MTAQPDPPEAESGIEGPGSDDPGARPGKFTERGQEAEQSAFRGEGSYSAGEFAAGVQTSDS